MRQILLLGAGCVLVLAGCTGQRHGSAPDVRGAEDSAVCAGRGGEILNRRTELVLSDYGRRLVEMSDRDWDSLPVHPQVGGTADIEWLCHFGPFLELEAETETDTGSVQGDEHQARMRLIRYVTEKIYPVRVSLKVVRGGRRFLLGDYIDSYIRDLEVRRQGSGFTLIYRTDF